jgi:hypothetical protein
LNEHGFARWPGKPSGKNENGTWAYPFGCISEACKRDWRGDHGWKEQGAGMLPLLGSSNQVAGQIMKPDKYACFSGGNQKGGSMPMTMAAAMQQSHHLGSHEQKGGDIWSIVSNPSTALSLGTMLLAGPMAGMATNMLTSDDSFTPWKGFSSKQDKSIVG